VACGGLLRRRGELYTPLGAAQIIPTAGSIGRPGELHGAASSWRKKKRNFAKTPLAFWGLCGILKTGLKTIVFFYLATFWSSKITLNFM
jgi:hypothetical protein